MDATPADRILHITYDKQFTPDDGSPPSIVGSGSDTIGVGDIDGPVHTWNEPSTPGSFSMINIQCDMPCAPAI
jgi:hypothetical protein